MEFHLDAVSVRFSTDVVVEDIEHVLLTGQFVAPHLQQILFGCSGLQVEEIVVGEFTEHGRRRVAPATVRKLLPVRGSVHVALRTRPPENGPHRLLTPVVIGRRFPWQRPLGLLTPHAQSLENLDGRHFPVERVEMETVDPTAVEQLFAQVEGQIHAVVSDRLIIVLDGFNGVDYLLRHFKFGQLHNVSERLVRLQGKSFFSGKKLR